MLLRLLLAASCAVSAVSCSRSEAPAADARASAEADAASEPAAALDAVADAYLDLLTGYNPLTVYFGLTDVMKPDHAALPDLSPQALAAFESAEDELLARLDAIDPDSLTATGDWVTWQALKETMTANRGLRTCNQPLWSVSHMTGWQSFLSDVAARQPVETAEERDAALARWSALPRFIAQDRANLEVGLVQGYSAPKSVVRKVVGQLATLADTPFADHPYFVFAAKADDAEFTAAMEAAFNSEVAPAIASFRDFLESDYLPAAREELSISVLPDGAECYEAMLRSYHSADIGAARTYERGQETVAANRAGVVARGEALFGESDFETILAKVKDVPENRFSSEQELIDFTRELVPVTREKVARFFLALPEQKMIVEPYPDYLKGTGQPSRYESKPPAEGSATYRIDTDDWANQTRGEAEIVAVHEGWPGHHLQIATAYDLAGLHPVSRLAASTAFIEGWARYSEALAEEAGIYKDGYGEITRRAWPARGMVVDPGLHVYGWTNEQAIEFLKESGRDNDATAADLLDRIAVIPGQLTAYDTGGLEIFALRAEAEERLGDRFDIRAFHARVLENGPVPLGALREHVEAWIASEESAGD